MPSTDMRQGEIAALRREFEQARSDRERALLAIRLGTELAQSEPSEGERFLRLAIDLSREAKDHQSLFVAARTLCEHLLHGERPTEARACTDVVLEAARGSGVKRYEGAYNFLLGRIEDEMQDFEAARTCYERSREIWQGLGYLEGVYAAWNQLGSLHSFQGRPAEALECYQHCVELSEEVSSDVERARNIHNVGLALAKLGRWEDAAESYYRSLAITERVDCGDLRSYVYNSLGELFLGRNELPKAIELLKRAVHPARPEERGEAMVREAMTNLAQAYFRQGDLAGAEQTCREAARLIEKAGDRRQQAMLLSSWAALDTARGLGESALERASQAVELAASLGIRQEQCVALRAKAVALAARGDKEGARDSFESSIALLSDLEDSHELAMARFHYGRFLMEEGERTTASGHLKAAARVFRKLAVVAEADEVNRLLFHHEVAADRDMALLSGVSGLATMGLEPMQFLQRALELLREALRFDSGVLLLGKRPVLLSGRPNVQRALECSAAQEVLSAPDCLSWSVVQGGAAIARVYLERYEPREEWQNHLILETVANLLATAVQRLVEMPPPSVEEQTSLSGLRYRGVVGSNPVMRRCLVTAGRVAGTNVPVLILGESGTGKELVARAIHDSSPRAGRPFLAVNSAALPEALLEAEFFGIEKGAATGVAARKGKFEQADGGTVFLDEIGDMSPALQAKLLRVIQEQAFERVGGRESIRVDVRLVAATNQDLPALMESGKFRRDLYYRLNTVELELPPLRGRREDVTELARYFINRSNREFKRDIVGLSPETQEQLCAFHWPGNIRQLEHVIERAVLLAQGDFIRPEDLPAEIQPLPGPAVVRLDLRGERRMVQVQAVADLEKSRLLDCLGKANWNVKEAAKLSGFSRAQFYRLLRKHGISRPA